MRENRVEKLFLPCREHLGDTGLRPLQAIDQAAWVWHPAAGEAPDFLWFRRRFAARPEPLVLHVSADERYELFLDGRRISRGPDRSGLPRWSYASYRVELSRGTHTLEAQAWRLGGQAPVAQLSCGGGFILKAEGAYDADLTTGAAPWTVRRLRGYALRPQGDSGVFGIGDELVVDANERFQKLEGYRRAVVIRRALGQGSFWGVPLPGWMLFPSTLPDRLDRPVQPGRVAAAAARLLAPVEPVRAEDCRNPAMATWQALLGGNRALSIPPRSKAFVLWDLGNYYCAYPLLEASGGKGASVTWGWSESLRHDERRKDNRDEIAGKHLLCRGDAFLLDGRRRTLSTHWWRAGRYCLLNIETQSEPLTLHRLALDETRYPLEMEGAFRSPEPQLQPVIDLCVRGMQMCSHETFMDCPHYEQLMYVGDTRLEMLTTYVLTRDERLVRRGIGLFDESRVNWGFVNERYPSRDIQHSPTFSLIWTLMLHDYAHWRNDLPWVRARMIGLRSMLEHFEPYTRADGLLHDLPGWLFMDWVKGWSYGVPPIGPDGVSSSINLLYLLALQKAAELEGLMGEPLLARRQARRAAAVKRAVAEGFWDRSRGLMADDRKRTAFSEHTQCLAILSGAAAGAKARRALNGLLTAPDLKRASHYFRFYLFETLRRMGRADLIIEKLEPWKEMLRLGCRTPLESYEPSRSDCHAWSSHPLFHLYASIAGIRPASPGFRTVRIEPQLGPWKELRCRMPHPDGWIALDLHATARGLEGAVTLPAAVTGVLRWNGRQAPLRPRRQSVRLTR